MDLFNRIKKHMEVMGLSELNQEKYGRTLDRVNFIEYDIILLDTAEN